MIKIIADGDKMYKEINNHLMKQGQQTFSLKGQVTKILGIARHILTVSATPLGHCRVKAAIGNIKKWVWRHSNKILFAKTGSECNLAWGP